MRPREDIAPTALFPGSIGPADGGMASVSADDADEWVQSAALARREASGCGCGRKQPWQMTSERLTLASCSAPSMPASSRPDWAVVRVAREGSGARLG